MTATHPLGGVRKEGGAKACFSSTRKGALAFFGQRALGTVSASLFVWIAVCSRSQRVSWNLRLIPKSCIVEG